MTRAGVFVSLVVHWMRREREVPGQRVKQGLGRQRPVWRAGTTSRKIARPDVVPGRPL